LFAGGSAKSVTISYELNGEFQNSCSKWHSVLTPSPAATAHGTTELSAQQPKTTTTPDQLLNESEAIDAFLDSLVFSGNAIDPAITYGGLAHGYMGQQLSQPAAPVTPQHAKSHCDKGEQLNTPFTEPQFEFDFSNSGTNDPATKQPTIVHPLSTLSINSSHHNNNIANTTKACSITKKQQKEFSSAWCDNEISLLAPDIADEPTSPASSLSAATTPFDDNLFGNSEVMCLDDFDTPPIDFQDDIMRYSKLVDDQHQSVIQAFEEKKPLPSVVARFELSQESEASTDVVFDDMNTPFGSQEPTMDPKAILVDVSAAISVDQQASKQLENKSLLSNLVMDDLNKKERRVPKLKVKIPMDFSDALAVSTPEIINDTLELENQFDLVNYITSQNTLAEEVTCEDVKPNVDHLPPKRKSTISIEELAADVLKSPKHSYNIRTRCSSPSTSIYSDYINPSSVASTTSDDTYEDEKPKKRRGRPPKPVEALLDPNELANLSPEDMRYREQRNKNNEASRRSRMNRKDREGQLEQEAYELEQQYKQLEVEEQKLVRKCERWKQAVMQIALLN